MNLTYASLQCDDNATLKAIKNFQRFLHSCWPSIPFHENVISRDCAGDFLFDRVLELFQRLNFISAPSATQHHNCAAKSRCMERININYPEEKVLRLFTAERRPLTAAELLDYLKSLDFGTPFPNQMSDPDSQLTSRTGGGQYILQSLLRKKLLASKSLSDGTLLYYPSHQVRAIPRARSLVFCCRPTITMRSLAVCATTRLKSTTKVRCHRPCRSLTVQNCVK